MAIEHSLAADPDIHEPKDISTATLGQVYISDGAGSGDWINAEGSKTILISVKADLPTPAAGVIILAANTEYRFLADVSLGTDRLVLGDNTVIRGIDSLSVTITYTGTGDMFTMADTTNRVSFVTLACALGRVFNWSCTSTKILRVHDVTIASADKVGLFTGVAGIIRFTNVSPSVVTTDGLEFVGDFRSFLWEVSAFTISAGAIFNLGTATFDSFITDTVLATLNGTANLVSGAASSANINTGGIGLVNVMRISGTGTPLSGVSPDDALWEFRHNDDIQDTRPDGLLSMQGNAVNTVIAVSGTYVLVAGTWVVERSSQTTGTTAGRITYNGGKDATLPIAFTCSVEPASGTNKLISLRLSKNGTPVANSTRTAQTNTGVPTSITVLWQDVASTGDFYEVFATNDTDTIDVLVSSAIARMN